MPDLRLAWDRTGDQSWTAVHSAAVPTARRTVCGGRAAECWQGAWAEASEASSCLGTCPLALGRPEWWARP